MKLNAGEKITEQFEALAPHHWRHVTLQREGLDICVRHAVTMMQITPSTLLLLGVDKDRKIELTYLSFDDSVAIGQEIEDLFIEAMK